MQHRYKPRIRKGCTCLCQATAACEGRRGAVHIGGTWEGRMKSHISSLGWCCDTEVYLLRA